MIVSVTARCFCWSLMERSVDGDRRCQCQYCCFNCSILCFILRGRHMGNSIICSIPSFIPCAKWWQQQAVSTLVMVVLQPSKDIRYFHKYPNTVLSIDSSFPLLAMRATSDSLVLALFIINVMRWLPGRRPYFQCCCLPVQPTLGFRLCGRMGTLFRTGWSRPMTYWCCVTPPPCLLGSQESVTNWSVSDY